MFSRVFSLSPKGPMPLMANLMLSTRRAIVNHPHYEDVALRQKTRKVYQMYSRRSPEEYKQTLKELQVHYVVLHSGWCLEKPWVYTKNNRIWKKIRCFFFVKSIPQRKFLWKWFSKFACPKKPSQRYLMISRRKKIPQKRDFLYQKWVIFFFDQTFLLLYIV